MAEMTQREYWNSLAGERWAADADIYDAILAPFASAIIEQALFEPRMRVLDVGCGNGGLALQIAELVGPEGSVIGVDLSSQMLAVARQRAEQRGLPQAVFVQDDAQTHPFEPASFDHIVSRFGVMFFDDPVAAFANLRSALRPHGEMTFACWQDITLNDWILVPVGALSAHLEPSETTGPNDPHAPGPFALSDPDRIRELLTAAGFSRIDLIPCERMEPFGTTQDAFEFFERNDVIKGLLEGQPQRCVDAALEALRGALADNLGPNGIELRGSTWVVRARH